jgi:thiamine-phosphate pyrophosphorylase
LPTLDAILRSHRIDQPVWYGISNRRLFPELPVFAYLEALFTTSAQIIQWREKDLPREENVLYVKEGVRLARRTGKLFLVNTDAELALRECADGVHLTASQDAVSVGEVLGGPQVRSLILGQSVHSAVSARTSARLGCDYLLLGPVFDPLSKKAYREPLGLRTLERVARESAIPVFALGGLDESRVSEALSAGAAGVAGIGWVHREVEEIVGH